MLGLTFDKLLVIGVIAVFLLGPERLPQLAGQLARFVRLLKGMSETAKGRMQEELGEEFSDIDWKRLDPRQYDPRRIIRDALLEEPPAPSLTEVIAQTERAEAEQAAALHADTQPAVRGRSELSEPSAAEREPRIEDRQRPRPGD